MNGTPPPNEEIHTHPWQTVLSWFAAHACKVAAWTSERKVLYFEREQERVEITDPASVVSKRPV